MTKPVTIQELLATLRFHRVVASGGGRFTVLAKNKQILGSEIDIAADQEIWSTQRGELGLSR